MFQKIKTVILVHCAILGAFAFACSPKPAESDAAVADANIGELPLDVVIRPKDFELDSPALPEAAGADETGGVIEADVLIDAAEVVDVLIPPDILPDAIADAGEVDQIGDTDAAQIDQSEVADSTDAQKDTFLSTPDLGPCVSKDLTVYADSLSDDSVCVKPCPTDHPCICGDCAWVQTPPTVQPRWGASAVWTGTEIVLLGGWPGADPPFPITAERWNPKSGKGWEMINTPPTKSEFRSVQAHWDGKYVWAIVQATAPTKDKEEYSFRWDPATNTSVKLAMTERMFRLINIATDRASVWANGQLFEHGVVADPVNGGGKHAFALYDKVADKWTQTAFPDKLVEATGDYGSNQFACAVASGDDVFIYNSSLKPAAASGLDAMKPITLRFHIPDATWSAVSQAMPIDTIQYPSDGDGFLIGTETGFVIWGSKEDPVAKNPAQGAIYNKQTDTWTVMAKLVPDAYAINTHRQSALVGDGIYTYSQYFFSDVNTPAQKGWKANTVEQFHIDSNTWTFLTPVGFPTDRRQETGLVVGNNELYLIGGIDGPKNANIIHKDGVRLALPGSKP